MYSMPTFVYRCANGHLFDFETSAYRQSETSCPACGATAKKDFGATVRSVIIRIPIRHRADKEIELTRVVVGETPQERERTQQMLQTGKLVQEDKVKDWIEEHERIRKEEENAPRITKEIWEEAKRLTDNGRKPFIPPTTVAPEEVNVDPSALLREQLKQLPR